ncbi:MAG: insulinase family protein, partial [Bacteroidales bacterium]
MKNKMFWLLLTVCFCCTEAVIAFSRGTEKGTLKQDGQFLIGKLDNGLTYYIRKNENPKQNAEFFIAHNVGSLQEDDNQRGLAHFLEHMAFNGTKNFPGKNMLNSLASIGVKFGNNVNAFTSMDRTVYNISAVPVVRESVIDSVLLMLHDWSYSISCEPAEIEAERGVIREEWRRGDDTRTKMMAHIAAVEQSGSQFAKRRVIGLPEIINTFKPQTLVDYYHKWYRPDLQAIFVVGDINPVEVEKKIKKIFSSIPKGVNNAPRLMYEVPDHAEPIIDRYIDPELRAGSVRIVIKFPSLKGKERLQERFITNQLLTDMCLDMVSGRISKNTADGKSLYKTAVPTMGEIYYASKVFRITAIPLKNNYDKAFTGIIADYERLKKYGFSKEEFSDALQARKTKLQVEANKNRNPTNVDYVNRAVDAFTRGDALMDVADYYKTSLELIDKITIEDMSSFVSGNFGEKNMIVIFAGGQKDAEGFLSDERARVIIDSVRNANLSRYEYIADGGLKFNYKLKPLSLTKVSDFTPIAGATQAILPKGNKIIWIENNSNPAASISFTSYREGGFSAVEDSLLYHARMMKSCLGNFKINGMDRNTFYKFCTNNRFTVKQDIKGRYDFVYGYFMQNNPDAFFQTLYLSMCDVTADSKSFAGIRQNRIKKAVNNTSAINMFKDSCAALSYKPNSMSGKWTKEIVNGISDGDILRAYNQHFCSSEGFTYIFEGPMSFEQARPFLEKYMANLPCQKDVVRKKICRDDIWNKGMINLNYVSKNTASSKASVAVNVKGTVDYTVKNYNCARFMVMLLRDRYTKSIREQRGGSYHVGVEDEFNLYPDSYLTIRVDFDTDPKLVDELVECVWDELKNLAKESPGEQDVDKIKRYLTKSICAKSEKE